MDVRHQCMIYDGPPSRMLGALVVLLRAKLEAGFRCLYMNSPPMVAGVRSLLYAAGTDVQREIDRGALVFAADSSHLVAGRFSIDHLIDQLSVGVDDALAAGFTGLFATGDMSWEFGPERDFSKLVDYEFQLEQLFKRQPALCGICQYHRDLLPVEAVRVGVVAHEGAFINETLTKLNPHYVIARNPDDWKAEVHPALDTALLALLAKP
jgi:hypothetical protein